MIRNMITAAVLTTTLATQAAAFDTDGGCIECPAVYDVCEDYASLVSFSIGARKFNAADAIAMTGLHHVQRQEVQTRDEWLEQMRANSNRRLAEWC